MMHPILLFELARLREREIRREIASRQISYQVKTTQTARPGLIKRLIMVSFTPNKNRGAAEAENAFSG